MENTSPKHKQLPNGVIMLTTSNDTIMHQCNYCEIWFEPKRRFMQKYCNDSCRVMASRKRHHNLFGLAGGTYRTRNNTTNTELYTTISDLRAELGDLKTKTENNTRTIQETIKDAKYDVKTDIGKVHNLQYWNIAASVIMPLVSPYLGTRIKEIFNPNKPYQDLQSFYEKINPFLDKAPKELRDNIYLSMTAYFEATKPIIPPEELIK